MPADAVARATFRAIDRGKSEIAVGKQAKLFLLASRIAPRFVDWGLSRWLLKNFPDAPVLRNASTLLSSLWGNRASPAADSDMSGN
jgi:hypothetical protein